ncbi:hypothetical protein CFC21_053181 [Triticum aestivum]|uniref:O-methyltransferase ZRP4 n=3 Tax=Triticum TaxID=4564 RepID=A0A9R0SFX3_TRITD|nr:hypothetical protein CFC21_053181 [Triticum aestivum]VAH94370.1 unnamed protein product [Triticum turgidum subsp. durum]
MAAEAQQLTVPTEAELLQGQADLWRHSLYYMTSMAFQCAVKLGVPTTIHSLGGAASLPDLVAALSLPPAKLPYLRRIMRLLATSGVFAADNAADVVTYRLTPVSWLLLDSVAVDGHPNQTPIVLAATSRHCIEAFPQIKCTVLDLPKVIDNVPADGVVNYVAGDMFKSVPPAQAVLIKLVLHHWSDEDCVKILAQCKKAIPSREEGGKVIVIDIVVDSSSGPTHEAELLMDVAMMVMTNGRQRDETDWSEIFTKAGFSDYKLLKKLGARGVFDVYP